MGRILAGGAIRSYYHSPPRHLCYWSPTVQRSRCVYLCNSNRKQPRRLSLTFHVRTSCAMSITHIILPCGCQLAHMRNCCRPHDISWVLWSKPPTDSFTRMQSIMLTYARHGCVHIGTRADASTISQVLGEEEVEGLVGQ